MKAIIEDYGDMSVGIQPQRWEVDCPFPQEELLDHKDWFSEQLANLYGEFANGRLIITYQLNTLPELPSKEDKEILSRIA